MRRQTCNVLVIGGGIAGLQAAETAAQFVRDVVLVDRGTIGESTSSQRSSLSLAAYLGDDRVGGFPMAYTFGSKGFFPQFTLPAEKQEVVKESFSRFKNDVMAVGGHLSDPVLVDLAIRGIYNRIGWLEAYGLQLVRDGDRGIYRVFSAPGHSQPRVCVLIGSPNAAMRAFQQGAAKLGVQFHEKTYVTKILTQNGRAVGAYALDWEHGEPILFETKAIILATGGADSLYRQDARGSSGSGYILALKAGAKLANMEFIQFVPEPTAIPNWVDAGALLLGAGIRLKDARGQFIVSKYGVSEKTTPLAELMQVLYQESQGGEVTSELSQAAREVIDAVPALQVLTGESITWKVGMAGHLGGVVNKAGATDVDGLFVGGEVATGCHGADALPGMLLSFTLCSAEEAAIKAAKYSTRVESMAADLHQVQEEENQVQRKLAGSGSSSSQALTELEANLRKLMWTSLGPIREKAGLEAAERRLHEWRQEIETLSVADFPSLVRLRELQSAVITAQLIWEAARRREESRGQHRRIDHPERDDAQWSRWIVISMDGEAFTFQSVPIENRPSES